MRVFQSVGLGRWFVRLMLAGGLMLLGLGSLLLAPLALASPGDFSTCPTGATAQSTFQSLLDDNQTVTYTGTSPCTINLTSSITIDGGVTQTIDGGTAGLTLIGDADPSTNTPGTFPVIDISDYQNPSTLKVRRVTTQNGGYGIYGAYSTIDLDQGTVEGNLQYNPNGNILPGNGIYASVVNLTRSTITNNGNGFQALGSASVENSTISNNLYTGLAVYPDQGPGAAIIVSSTISDNGTGIGAYGGATTVSATILNNTTNCQLDGSSTVTDGGYNLVSLNPVSNSTTCDDVTFSEPPVTSDQLNLLPLGNYGGPTATVALGPGSVAIDAIPGTTCAAYTYPNGGFYSGDAKITTDQRGTDRPQGGKCDIGAYEAPAVGLSTSPSAESSGWITSLPVSVTAGFSGLADGEIPACSGATFTGLPTIGASGLNQTATGTASLTSDDSYTVDCSVSLSGAALGISSGDGLALPATIQVDSVAPTITSPTDGADYTIGATVPLSCSDATAEIATCQVTVTPPSGSPVTVSQDQNLPTSQPGNYTVTPNTVSDNAGNQDTTSLTYTVTGYEPVALPGNTDQVRHGFYAVIRITFADGSNYVAARNIPLTSTSLVGPDGAHSRTIPFVHTFQFARFGRTPGYQLQLNTRNLASGVWTLNFHLGGAHPQDGQVTFTVN